MQRHFRSIRLLIGRLVSVGTEGVSPEEERQILTVNQSALLTTTIAALFGLMEFWMNWTDLAMAMLVAVVLLMTPLILNQFHFHELAAYFLTFILNGLTFSIAITLDPAVGARYFFFLLVGFPLILFPLHKKKAILFGVTSSVFFYIMTLWIEKTVGFFHVFHFLPVNLLAFLAQTAIFIIGFFFFYYFRKLSDRFEQQALQSTQTLVSTAKMTALGEMSGGLAHEVNTPLATIQLSAAQLKELLAEPLQNRDLIVKTTDRIEATAHRISGIVQALRWFAHDSGKKQMDWVHIDQIIDSTLLLCSEHLRESAIDLRYSPSKNRLLIYCHEGEIAQLLYQLISNARDAASASSQKWVQITVEKNKTNQVIVRVSDSGPGIPAAIREKIFEPFFTTKGVGGGTGMGLSMAQGIAKKHGGELFLDASAPHTQFVLKLPLNHP